MAHCFCILNPLNTLQSLLCWLSTLGGTCIKCTTPVFWISPTCCGQSKFQWQGGMLIIKATKSSTTLQECYHFPFSFWWKRKKLPFQFFFLMESKNVTWRAWWNAVPGMLIVIDRSPAMSPLYRCSIVSRSAGDLKLTRISQMLRNAIWIIVSELIKTRKRYRLLWPKFTHAESWNSLAQIELSLFKKT